MSQKKKKLERKNQVEVLTAEVKKKTQNWVSVKQIIKDNWKIIAAILVGAVLIYLNSLGGNFVSDDYATIPQNPILLSWNYLKQDTNLVVLSNIIIAKIFGVASSVPYHVWSLILFLAVCAEVYVISLLLFEKRKVAIIATILFAVLPIHVEAVSWISGKPYLFNALFVLAALICLIEFIKSYYQKGYLMWLGVFLVLAFFSEKARSLAFFLTAGIYLITYQRELLASEKIKKLILASVGIVIVMGIILIGPIKTRIESVNSGYNMSESVFYNPFFQYPTSMTKYLQLLAVPVDLTLYHTMYTFPVWLNWAVVLIYVGMLGYFFFKNKNLFFALAFIFAAAAPSMAPIKVSWLVAERYMFLGSVGFALLLALLMDSIGKKMEWAALLAVVVLVGLYGGRTYLRNIDWQTNHNLWVNTIWVSPNSHNAWNNIGDDYDKLKQYENAIKSFTQSTVVKNNYADAYHNRANIFYKMNRLDLARDSYEAALKYSPGLYQTYISLIQLDVIERNAPLAIQHANKAVSLNPNNPQSHYVLGYVLAQVGDKENAKKELRTALGLAPGYTAATQLMAEIDKK